MGEEFILTDRYGINIYGNRFRVDNPKAVIHIVHGVGEHSGRYQWLTERLNEAGFSVYRHDQRGHGKTGVIQHEGQLEKMGKLGPGGIPAVVENLRLIREYIETEEPNLPLYYFGHSWGSLVGQILWNTDAAFYAGLILSGTAFRTVSGMNSGDLNAKHKHLGTTGVEWLSRDEQVAKDFRKDPLTFDAQVLKLFGPVNALRLFGKPAQNLPDRPILIQVGSDDTLGGGESAELLAESYRHRSSVSDVTVHIYPGARHEIYNETNKDEVVADLITWLTKHQEI